MVSLSQPQKALPALLGMLSTGLLVAADYVPDYLPVTPECGFTFSPCCPGNVCDDFSSCVAGTCYPCGFATSMCCEGGSCYENSYFPDSPTCNADNLCVYDAEFYEYDYIPPDCGFSGLPCCDGDECEYSFDCVGDMCEVCGFELEPCCGGTDCFITDSECLPDGTCSSVPFPPGPDCGEYNLPCCEGDMCEYSYDCVDDMCGFCGFVSERCCDGTTCLTDGSECLPDGTCSGLPDPVCGFSGLPCCPGDACASGSECVNGMCEDCGFSGVPCCSGDVCDAFSTCDAGVCEACGFPDSPCCPGDFCFSRSQCTRRGQGIPSPPNSNGAGNKLMCEACGSAAGEPCCGSTCFGGLACLRGKVCVESLFPSLPPFTPFDFSSASVDHPLSAAKPGERPLSLKPKPKSPPGPAKAARERASAGRGNSQRGRSNNTPGP
eukprot:jgi/Ulvmu1/2131/UM128_0001.1